jgi:PAS domain S-box-containing protein
LVVFLDYEENTPMNGKPSYEELEQRVKELEDATCNLEQIEKQLLKLSHAVEQSPSAIMITGSRGIIEYVNPRFTEMTGYSAEGTIGKNAAQLGEQSPEEERRMWETIKSGAVWRGEFYNKKRNGQYYWERASISPITNEDHEITNFVKISEDVTELKRAQEALGESEKRRYRDQKRMAVLKFANDVALKLMDELRNPLVAIGGFARRIAKRDYPTDKLPEYAKIIFQQSEKLDRALNRALAHLKAASDEV